MSLMLGLGWGSLVQGGIPIIPNASSGGSWPLAMVSWETGNGWTFQQSGSRFQVQQPMRGIYRLKLGSLVVDVDAQRGGRIIAFDRGWGNVLQGNEVNPQNYGSTFWVSPQQLWDWPPPPEIDRDPYEVTFGDRALGNRALVLTSAPSPTLGIQVQKVLTLEAEPQQDPALVVTYRVTNVTDRPVQYAPWEVSRVSPTGLTFYPTGSRIYQSPAFGTPPTHTAAGVTWIDHDRPIPPQDHKLLAEGSGGWLAHLDDGQLFLKTFTDIPPGQQAPLESEIEVYINGDRTYVEMEHQGAYTTLKPQESLTWTVRWSLHQVPPHVAPELGNGGLVDWITGGLLAQISPL